MKRKIAASCIVIAMLFTFGCAAVTSEINSIEAWMTGQGIPDVCAAATFYQNYLQGVLTAIELIPVVATAVGPFVTLANTAIDTLVADCNSGALLATITTDLTNMNNVIAEINAIVGTAAQNGQIKLQRG